MTLTAPPPPLPPAAPTAAALKVEDLELAYLVRGIPRPVLRGVSFEIAPGEAYGLVGESGCGKSTTAYAAVRYLPRNGRITGGRILISGEDITKMSDDEVRRFRTHHASMVYQDPGSALNPSTRIGPQVIEAFTVLGQDAKTAHDNALGALARVQIADPERVFNRYPHQLSGGMQQRVVIAMALASDPQLLVLDEPTTGLDATVEASVLDLVRTLRAETNAAVLLIAHNLGVIRSICDRVGVMYAGKIVEEGPAVEVFEAAKHPYTVGLLQSLPRHGVRKSQRPLATIPGTLPQIGTPLPTCVFVDRCALATDLCREVVPPVVPVGDGRWSRCHHIDRIGELVEGAAAAGSTYASGTTPMLTMTAVSKTFHQSGHDVPALVKVDLELKDGETLGLVGESGSGKSTLAKTILGIESADVGSRMELDDQELKGTAAQRPIKDKRSIQMVFQNPDSALNRGWSVRQILQSLRFEADRPDRQGRRRARGPTGRGPEADPAPPRPQAAPAVRRPEAARGHRAGVRRRPADRRRRRTDERARRLGPGRDPQRPGRAPDPQPDRLPAHLARPRRRPLSGRPDRGHVPRPDPGGRRLGEALRGAEPSVHRGAPVGRAERGRRGQGAHPPRGRHPEPGQPAAAAACSTRAAIDSSRTCAR